jgi:hypothetical protein
MKKIILLLTLALALKLLLLHNKMRNTQYMYNTININPAYAGSRGVMSIFALQQNKW